MEKNQPESLNDKIVEKIRERLEIGKRKYGSENVAFNRNFTRESLEEILDCCVYVACAIYEYEQSLKLNNKDQMITDLDQKCKVLEHQLRMMKGGHDG